MHHRTRLRVEVIQFNKTKLASLIRTLRTKAIRKVKYQSLKTAILILFAIFFTTFSVARGIMFATFAFGDTAFVSLNSGPFLAEQIFCGWHRTAYGESYPAPLAYIFLYAFQQLSFYLRNVDCYYFMLNMGIPLSMIAFYSFLGKFTKSVWFRLFGAALYIINPVTVSYYIAGGFIWSLVFLPLSISFFLDFLKRQKLKDLLKTAVFINLTLWTFPALALGLAIAFISIVLCHVLTIRVNRRNLHLLLLRLFIGSLFIAICNPHLLYSYFSQSSQDSLLRASNIVNDFKYTYQVATLPNFLRLAGNIGSPQQPLGYNNFDLRNAIGYIIPIVAFLSVLWFRRGERKNEVLAMLSVGLSVSFCVVLIRYITHSDLVWIIEKLPVTWTLRNPFKLQLIFLVSILPLFVFSLEKITKAFTIFYAKKDIVGSFITLTIILLGVSQIYIYNPYPFSGYMGLDKIYGDLQRIMPDSVICSIINDSRNSWNGQMWRGLILPFDHKAELHVQFENPLLHPERLGIRSNVAEAINDALTTGSEVVNLLCITSTKYVYVNNAWTYEGFIIIPDTPLETVKTVLKDEKGLTKKEMAQFSKFTAENALPRLYLSTFPVYYSSIESISSLNSSIMKNNPVFLPMESVGYRILTPPNETSPFIFDSYRFQVFVDGNYRILSKVRSNKNNLVRLYYRLDNSTINCKEVILNNDSLTAIDTVSLQHGSHTVDLATFDEAEFFTEIGTHFLTPFTGNGLCNLLENVLQVNNGILLSSKNYSNFDLITNFKATSLGKEGRHTPTIYFTYSNSSFFRLIFHKYNYVELSKVTATTPKEIKEVVVTNATDIDLFSWNNLRVKTIGGKLQVYLNGQKLFTYEDPMLEAPGMIGVGADNSAAEFKDVILRSAIKEIQCSISFAQSGENPNILEINYMDSASYLVQVQSDRPTEAFMFFGENYDESWEMKFDNIVIDEHQLANTYANAWFINVTKGTHKIEIYWKLDSIYKGALWLSVLSTVLMMVFSFLPIGHVYKVFSRRLFPAKSITSLLFSKVPIAHSSLLANESNGCCEISRKLINDKSRH